MTAPVSAHPNLTAWQYHHTAEEIAAFAHADPLYATHLQFGNRVEAAGDTLIILCRTMAPGPSTIALMNATPNEHGEWWCETWIVHEPTKLHGDDIPLSLTVHRWTSEPNHTEWLQDHCGAQPWWNFLRAITQHILSAARPQNTDVE